ncbi:ABC transporter substrate-binding protein [Pelobacter propionicus]|uniref:Iron(III) dicitrate-biding protein n=1 Tax=Pelobacter propionicus (strain DSM 2379 / NBRC 103807 / OttBd1) TaxID=338966 RepID=A1AP25_PELPD|nr:ABC transporter substrate-binding protein [Pelobacter propionicus]ABK99095.1 iron(III) dicitrate-biding protein [Pelobacter propionicus DSM 2379]
MKRLLVCLVLVFMPALSAGPCHGGGTKPAVMKTITDMDDRRIQVPVNPKRIVCMHGVSSERIMILGKGSSMTLMATKPSPWAYRLYPEMKQVRTVPFPATPNLEDMVKEKVDLLLYSPIPVETRKYHAVGIRTACGFSAGKRPRTIPGFTENFKRQIRFFGELLGPEARLRADRYCRYFDRKVGQILARTSRIARKDRPTVYYGGRVAIGGGGASLLATQGNGSVLHWNVEVAGGNYLPRAIDQNFAEVNRELLLTWNPDLILVSGWKNSADDIRKSRQWEGLKAVRNGSIYTIPQGVFAWEYASGESVLLMIYMAKIFHPHLFRDWDMKQEMREFYSQVYGKNITDRDAERILRNLPPA